jgi:hypothetical protein
VVNPTGRSAVAAGRFIIPRQPLDDIILIWDSRQLNVGLLILF